MFCSRCGQQIPDNSTFCCVCGAQLTPMAYQNQPGAYVCTNPPPGPGYGYANQPGGPGYVNQPGGPAYVNQPAPPMTKEGWMLLAIKDTIAAGLKDPFSVQYGNFENIEIDAYGRTYAEIVVHAKNSYGAYVPTRYAVGFFDVTPFAPCTVIPKSLFVFPGMMVGSQRKIAKKMIKFGQPR